MHACNSSLEPRAKTISFVNDPEAHNCYFAPGSSMQEISCSPINRYCLTSWVVNPFISVQRDGPSKPYKNECPSTQDVHS